MKMTNDILTKDALDEIFEIVHYSLETTKQKRSFFINEINSRGKIKITRQRRVDDQRSYDYLISSIKQIISDAKSLSIMFSALSENN